MSTSGSSGTTWSKAETLLLISIWGQERIQKKLQECKKNQSVYQEVADEMKDGGYDRTYQQCRDKIKKLKVEYKKERDRVGHTGEGKSMWDFFNEMDNILGHKPATKPPIVIDSMNTESEDVLPPQEQVPTHDNEEESLPVSSDSSTASLQQASENNPASDRSKSTPSPVQDNTRKRKKPPKPDNAIVDLLEQVISLQNKSDEKMIALEEKRLKIEERQMEREAEQRREERQFQMEMMRMMTIIAARMSLSLHCCHQAFCLNRRELCLN